MASFNRTFPKKKVVRALKTLGFRPTGTGTGDHDFYQREDGLKCQAKTCRRDVHIGTVNSIGNELETKGVIARREFIALVKRGRLVD